MRESGNNNSLYKKIKIKGKNTLLQIDYITAEFVLYVAALCVCTSSC